MCAQKPGGPRKTKRVADYVVVANYRVLSIREDESRSAQCNEISIFPGRGRRDALQSTKSDRGLKGRRREGVVFVLLDAAAMKGLGGRAGSKQAKRSRRQERQRPRKGRWLNAKKLRKLKVNSQSQAQHAPVGLSLKGKRMAATRQRERKRRAVW